MFANGGTKRTYRDLAHRWHEESKRRYEELAHQWLQLAEQRQRCA